MEAGLRSPWRVRRRTKGDGLAQQGLAQERKVSQDPEGRRRLCTRQWGPGPVRVAK